MVHILLQGVLVVPADNHLVCQDVVTKTPDPRSIFHNVENMVDVDEEERVGKGTALGKALLQRPLFRNAATDLDRLCVFLKKPLEVSVNGAVDKQIFQPGQQNVVVDVARRRLEINFEAVDLSSAPRELRQIFNEAGQLTFIAVALTMAVLPEIENSVFRAMRL
jgi:hypothetical protein